MIDKIPKSVQGAFERKAHPFHMWDGIQSIPEGLRDVLQSQQSIRKIAEVMPGKEPVYMIGCGTSYFAAIAATYVYQAIPQVQASASNAFEFLTYTPPRIEDSVLIGISHTGMTPTVVQSIQKAKAAGAVTIGFTDNKDSALRQEAGFSIFSQMGVEPALPKTRSYVSALLRNYYLSLELAQLLGKDISGFEAHLKQSPETAQAVLGELENEARKLANRFASSRRIAVAGGGPQWASAAEASLKLTEAALMISCPWELEEAVHGAWVSTQDVDLVIILAMEGPSLEKCERLAKGMKTIGANVWVLTNTDQQFARADHVTRVPVTGVPELFNPLYAILPLYQFTYFLALERGVLPDNMRLADPRYLEARTIMRDTI